MGVARRDRERKIDMYLVKLLMSLVVLLSIWGCGDGIYKCVFEKKNNNGGWDKRCETFSEEEVIDLETYCDKYDGYKTHSVRP